MRLAGDAAMTHMTGSEALRLFLTAAASARRAGDHAGAAIDLARAAELVARFPGMLGELPPRDEVGGWLSDARALAGGDARAEAAVLVATKKRVVAPLAGRDAGLPRILDGGRRPVPVGPHPRPGRRLGRPRR